MPPSIKTELTTAAKKVLPRWLVQYLAQCRRFRRFSPQERALYRRLAISGDRRAPRTARSLVFICYGNIMRSPMAAALLGLMLSGEVRDRFHVASAGLHANPNSAADPRSLRMAPEFGVSLDHHRSTQLTRQMVDEADAVFAMDRSNQVEFLSLYPDAERKLFMLGTYAVPKLSEIPDPFMGDEEDLRRCYRDLELCLRNLVRDLSGEQ
jgi:protein-tyrosine-phosphatase